MEYAAIRHFADKRYCSNAVHSIEQGSLKGGEYFNIMFHPSLFKWSEDDMCYTKYVIPFLNGEKTKLFCCQFQTIISQIGIKTHSCKFLK